ncbi:MAG: hypothetical protein LQ349_003147 [Xanthoria aureola]|nr:MAG: hypothetical protein LQ349_003147 [Xanthoria aureola]
MPEGTVHAPLLLTKINLNAAETAGNNVSTAAAHENLARVETPGGRWGDHMGAASHFQETSTTSRIVGQAPLLLGLMLANNNNNNPNNTNPEASQPVGPVGTTIVHEHVTEVEIPSGSSPASHDNNNKSVAIPGTIGIHKHTTEVEHSRVAWHEQNGKIAAIPGSIGVFAQTTEVYNAHGKVNAPNDFGILHLQGEHLPRPLTQEQCNSYKKNGYLVISNASTSQEATNLLDTTYNVMKRVSEGGEGITRHEIIGDGANAPSPVGRIIATFEPGDKTASSPFTRRIARLGCGVHKMPPFDTLTHSAFNRAIVRSLGYKDPRITQAQLIAKLAGIGGEVVPHNDGCVSFTDPPSAITFWYALEDATVENGCLCVAEGSHLTEPLRQRLVKDKNGQPKFEDLETPLWAQEAGEVRDAGVRKDYEYKPLEVKKGTLVLFHGNLLHKSGANTSGRNRVAYNFNVVEGGDVGKDDDYLRPDSRQWERL